MIIPLYTCTLAEEKCQKKKMVLKTYIQKIINVNYLSFLYIINCLVYTHVLYNVHSFKKTYMYVCM